MAALKTPLLKTMVSWRDGHGQGEGGGWPGPGDTERGVPQLKDASTTENTRLAVF